MRQTESLPSPLVLTLVDGSLQVAVSPCWEMALPDVISAILVWVHGPLPRHVPLVHLLASSQRTPASPHMKRVRHAKTTAAKQLPRRTIFRGCRHSITFKLPYSLGPQVAPTAEALCPQGSQAVYTTQSSVRYLPRGVVSLRVRLEQLTRQDFHLLDCSLVGCSLMPLQFNSSGVTFVKCEMLTSGGGIPGHWHMPSSRTD